VRRSRALLPSHFAAELIQFASHFGTPAASQPPPDPLRYGKLTQSVHPSSPVKRHLYAPGPDPDSCFLDPSSGFTVLPSPDCETDPVRKLMQTHHIKQNRI
jgi:hypothetical protein